MIHIKHILAKSLENASKAKFYTHNTDIFLRYFDSEEQYRALILAGNFEKMKEIIKKGSYFVVENQCFIEALRQINSSDNSPHNATIAHKVLKKFGKL